jgi:hypothetical protein
MTNHYQTGVKPDNCYYGIDFPIGNEGIVWGCWCCNETDRLKSTYVENGIYSELAKALEKKIKIPGQERVKQNPEGEIIRIPVMKKVMLIPDSSKDFAIVRSCMHCESYKPTNGKISAIQSL